MTTWMPDTPHSRGRILSGRGLRTESPNQAKKHFACVASGCDNAGTLVSKSDFLAGNWLLLVSKSDFLVSISPLLVSKSDFLVSISLLLVSKSDFLVADELASFSEDLSTLRRNPSLARREGPPTAEMRHIIQEIAAALLQFCLRT